MGVHGEAPVAAHWQEPNQVPRLTGKNSNGSEIVGGLGGNRAALLGLRSGVASSCGSASIQDWTLIEIYFGFSWRLLLLAFNSYRMRMVVGHWHVRPHFFEIDVGFTGKVSGFIC